MLMLVASSAEGLASGCICITLHPMAGQTSFRLPQDMLRELSKLARQRGVPKSQLVREALEQYLAGTSSAQVAQPMSVRERSAPYIGAIRLPKGSGDEEISVRIRRNNWRD